MLKQGSIIKFLEMPIETQNPLEKAERVVCRATALSSQQGIRSAADGPTHRKLCIEREEGSAAPASIL